MILMLSTECRQKPSRHTLLLSFLMVGLIIVLAACGQSNVPAQPIQYPDMGSVRTNVYIAKCSQCHAAPLPTSHRANIWPSVVRRMQMRMVEKSVQPLDPQEQQMVIDYLQQYAKP